MPNDWLIIEGAKEVRSTDAAILLRHHGREEWFPRAHVTLLTDGWYVARWLAESRTKKRVDTSCMRPRRKRRVAQTSTEASVLVLFLAVCLVWYAALEVACRSREVPSDRDYTAAVMAAYPHSQE